MSVYSVLSSNNVGNYEWTITYMLQLCGCLSVRSVKALISKQAALRGKRLNSEYVEKYLLNEMQRQRRIYMSKDKNYISINRLQSPDRRVQDAFWTLITAMEDVDIRSISAGPPPYQFSYHKNGSYYHILAVSGSGKLEEILSAGAHLNYIDINSAYPQKMPPERFIVIFESTEMLASSSVIFPGPTLYVCIDHDSNDDHPTKIHTYTERDLTNA